MTYIIPPINGCSCTSLSFACLCILLIRKSTNNNNSAYQATMKPDSAKTEDSPIAENLLKLETPSINGKVNISVQKASPYYRIFFCEVSTPFVRLCVVPALKVPVNYLLLWKQ